MKVVHLNDTEEWNLGKKEICLFGPQFSKAIFFYFLLKIELSSDQFYLWFFFTKAVERLIGRPLCHVFK